MSTFFAVGASHSIRAAQVLAAGTDDKDRASPIGLFVVLALCIAVYFLWKSMNRHLKKLPESFDDIQAGPSASTDLGSEMSPTIEPPQPPVSLDKEPPR
ncbi:hypothetical protein M6D93_05480 [Jatrophihabitans telluris]|uniref:Uncharacterized protein n=1 Tax=Jatrophihabitans telluris TaxID=2038343 RepID=A0ABY4R2A6_9ACTN|nr:hypothetical protein [Jatrophihabitans telluris]UQX89457.1 hypothetical protein M6D93_05480 [Jatrophihabitans telluris]